MLPTAGGVPSPWSAGAGAVLGAADGVMKRLCTRLVMRTWYTNPYHENLASPDVTLQKPNTLPPAGVVKFCTALGDTPFQVRVALQQDLQTLTSANAVTYVFFGWYTAWHHAADGEGCCTA